MNTIPVASLTPNDRNPRTITPAALKKLSKSIERDPTFMELRPIIVDGDGVILGGNQRFAACKVLGMTELPSSWVRTAEGLTDEQRKRFVLVDNAPEGMAGEWDLDLLLADWQVPELGDLGFDMADLAASLPTGEEVDAEPQTDRAEELRQEWGVEAGQLWALGDHRMLCGDSTKAEDVARLMGGASINIAFTSPPYASQRKYDESSAFNPIDPDNFVEWFEPIAANVKHHLASDGSWFVNIKPASEGLGTSLYVFDLVCAHVRQWGWYFATEFCWERTGVPKSVTRRFKNQFEPVYQFALGNWKMRPDAVQHASENVPMSLGKGSGNTEWGNDRQGKGGVIARNRRPIKGGTSAGGPIVEGMAYPGNRLPTFSSTHTALGHSAAFPVGLPSFFIKAFTDELDTVFDPFLGSGSTLVAAEQLGRKCYGMEISPAYCAVVLQRFRDATGKVPTIVAP